MKKKNEPKIKKIIDETVKIPDKQGNGILKFSASVDIKGKLCKYNFSYINPNVCHTDNGRVLGYDNSHGYHHRHYMGLEEKINFKSYEDIQNKFEQEWRTEHEKLKKNKK